MNEVLINKSSDINLIKNLKLKDVSKKSIPNLNSQSKYIIQNIISETIFDYNKEDENFINEKVLVQRKIECWNCNYIIISNPEWENVQCTNCNNINIIPDISFEEYANNKTFKNSQKHLEFLNIECPFCNYIMKTKKESKYLICNKCKNTIIIENTNSEHILNPYLDNHTNNISSELKSIKKIINPLNKKNGLLENIFNPMLDSNVIEKEFEMFLRIVAKREFEKWKIDLQNKEKELSLKYFEGYKKSEINNEICLNAKKNSNNINNFIISKKQNNNEIKTSKYYKSYLLDRIKYNIHEANKNIVNPVMLPLIVKKN